MKTKILFPICSRFKLFGLISLVLILPGLIALIVSPFGVVWFNFDIDFVGGTTMQIAFHQSIDRDTQDKINAVVEDVTGRSASSIQATGTSGEEVIIKMLEIDSATRDTLFDALAEEFGLTPEDKLLTDNVSASVGVDMQRTAMTASLLAVLLMLVYISFRFNFRSGFGAVVALVHDLLIVLSLYVIFQIPMSITFIAAALTVLGYSINATIIIFDRVRENMKFAGREHFSDIVDRSIWQTMSRTINTTVTTLIALVMLVLLGVQSVRMFAIPMLVGIVAGTYSSIFISGPMWNNLLKLLPQSSKR